MFVDRSSILELETYISGDQDQIASMQWECETNVGRTCSDVSMEGKIYDNIVIAANTFEQGEKYVIIFNMYDHNGALIDSDEIIIEVATGDKEIVSLKVDGVDLSENFLDPDLSYTILFTLDDDSSSLASISDFDFDMEFDAIQTMARIDQSDLQISGNILMIDEELIVKNKDYTLTVTASSDQY
jgi:hypothetical protein